MGIIRKERETRVLGEGGQKVQISLYKINEYWGCMYNMITVVNNAV